MSLENIEHEQACFCLTMTNYQSVEAASAYLNHKDLNGRYTHALIKLGGLCAICERPHNSHAVFYEDSSVKLTSYDDQSQKNSQI
jgi:hypothetical protein